MPPARPIALARRLHVAAAALALAACDAVGPEGVGDAANPGARVAEPRYVGGRVCAGCHEAEAERWAGSDHDLAMQPAEPSTVLGDFDGASFTHDGVTTELFRRGDEHWVRTDGADGELAEYRVAYTFGHDPLQQYLVEMPGGRYHALPVAWDSRPRTAGGQRWFHLGPDRPVGPSDPLHWTAPAHRWNSACAACHSTGLVKGYSPADDTFATRWASLDVDCESCHGPGSAHAAAPAEYALVLPAVAREWRLEAGARTAARTGPPSAEVETCAACHSRRAQIAEPFAAGEPLLDAFVPARLDDGLYHADGQIRDEVFVYGSFVQSAMYRAGVVCSDCHDPHGAEVVAEGNALCTRCHSAPAFDTPAHHRHRAGEPGSVCVDCHMRAETYMVVDPRRDHSFRVPRPDLSVTLGTPNACGDCHADEGAEWAAEHVRAWYPDGRNGDFHYGEAIHAGRAWSADRARLLRLLVGDAALPGIARATAVSLLVEHVDAGVIDAVGLALEDVDPLVQLAALDALASLPAEHRARLGQRFLTHPLRALRITAAAALATVREDLSARRRADLDAALDEYVAVQRLNADRAEGPFNHGSLSMRLGRLDEAEAAFHAAIAREPAFGPAHANLADLHRRLGRETDAEAALRAGLAASPDDAALHYALALSHVRAGRLAEALPALDRAVALAPDEPLYRYASALALDGTGDRDGALAALEAVAARFPGHVPTLFALATMHRDRGERDRALDYARRVLELSPSDPGGLALRAELER